MRRKFFSTDLWRHHTQGQCCPAPIAYQPQQPPQLLHWQQLCALVSANENYIFNLLDHNTGIGNSKLLGSGRGVCNQSAESLKIFFVG